MLNKSILFFGVAVAFIAVATITNTGAAEDKTPEAPADDKLKAIVTKLCPEIRAKIDAKCAETKACGEHGPITEVTPLTFRSVVVSPDSNKYCVKLCVTDGKKKCYWHASLQCHKNNVTAEVLEVMGPKLETDAL